MDRDQRWDRVQKAYKLLTEGKASFRYPDGLTALRLLTTEAKPMNCGTDNHS